MPVIQWELQILSSCAELSFLKMVSCHSALKIHHYITGFWWHELRLHMLIGVYLFVYLNTYMGWDDGTMVIHQRKEHNVKWD